MKAKTVLFVVLIVLVILMIHKPKKTTAQITAGEQGAVGVGSAVVGGFFTAPTHARKGR